MAKEEPEEVEDVYILIETGQILKAGDQVFQESDGRWQTMSPTVDGIVLVPGLKVRRKVAVLQRPHYIFLQTGDIIQPGDQVHCDDKWTEYLPGAYGKPIVIYHQLARRKVVCNG